MKRLITATGLALVVLLTGAPTSASPDDEATADQLAALERSFVEVLAETGVVEIDASACSVDAAVATCFARTADGQIVAGSGAWQADVPMTWTTQTFIADPGQPSPGSAPTSGAPSPGSLTPVQENAVRSAQSYLELMGFSRQGLIDQLSSEYGDQYDVADATVAVDSLDVDWNAQAVRSAESYLELTGFSCQGLVDQLSSEYGDQYTTEQAQHAAAQVGFC